MRDSGLLLQVVHEAMVKAKLDVNAIYAQLGYDAEKLPLRELRTPHQLQTWFWQTVEKVSGDPDIGLHLCPHLPPYRGEILEYLMYSSPTLGEAVARSTKYLRLVSDALDLKLVQDKQGARAVVQAAAMDAEQARHTEICVLYSMLQLVRNVTERESRLLKVRLRCNRRAPLKEYERVLGCPVEFGCAQSEIWFDPVVLDYRLPHRDPDLLQLHEQLADKRLSNIERQDLIERIRTLFSQRLEWENCDLEDVAKALNMPARRLRFELARAGTSFSEVLSEFRYALARRLLARTEEPIERIVYLTGFSEPSTFYRAFKRWSGATPLQYREQKRGNAAPV
ncbi:MAG: AraC family transcriptional regulator [Nevskiales bacterium]